MTAPLFKRLTLEDVVFRTPFEDHRPKVGKGSSGKHQKLVLLALVRATDRATAGTTFGRYCSIRWLCRTTEIKSRTTMRAALGALVDGGWIRWETSTPAHTPHVGLCSSACNWQQKGRRPPSAPTFWLELSKFGPTIVPTVPTVAPGLREHRQRTDLAGRAASVAGSREFVETLRKRAV